MIPNEYPIKLAPQAWLIGNTYFNLCCLRGRHSAILIEVGISAVADAAIGQLESLGVTPDHLVVTHPHSDHLTGLDILRRHYPQATLISGQGAADFFMHPKSAQAISFEDRHMNKRLDALGWQSDRPPVDSPPSEAIFDVMVDEAVLDLGGITVQFIEIHGHSPSNLAVWVPEKELLAASDALGFRYLDGSFLPLFFTGYAQYMHTLERLESFGPKVVCLGHQGPLSGRVALEAFGSARRAALAMRNRIRNYSGSDAILADEIFTEIYRDELRLYSEQNIRNCVRLLIHRARTE